MFARYLNAPLLLLLWQVAPVDAHRDPEGRVRISVMAGSGGYAFRDEPGYPAGVNCDGDPYPARPPFSESPGYSIAGVSGEGWARKDLRISAAYGNIDDFSGELQGNFGGAQAVLERSRFGFGLGLAAFGGLEGAVHPSATARVGSLERFSVRADYYAPGAAMGLVGGPRIGLGWNQGQSRKTRFLVGLATTPIPAESEKVGGFFELAFPFNLRQGRLGLSVNGFLGGQYHGNEDKRIYGVALGGWVVP